MEQQSNQHVLVATKLAIPPVRPGLVSRPHLFQKLEASLQYPLTLLAAPAGFGKTVVVSTWARSRQQSVGWVSLDSSDNDPVQFWTYVLTALDALHPGIGATPLSLLQSPQPASIETVLAALINALSVVEHSLVLVLDDYHVIEEPSIHRAMTYLLDHLPPQLHIVIASRVDPPLPLSRLRARHQLGELRADDLRFTTLEVAAFLNETMEFHLAEQDIVARLQERLEKYRQAAEWDWAVEQLEVARGLASNTHAVVQVGNGSASDIARAFLLRDLIHEPQETQAETGTKAPSQRSLSRNQLKSAAGEPK